MSTVEQNEDRQVEALKKYNIERWYIEKVSGKDNNRKALKEMLDFAREDDVIYTLDLSRLSRSVKGLLEIVEKLNEKKIHLVSLKENIDSSTPTGKLMLTMIGAINEFERTNLLERQREGIAIAKKKGVYRGRQPAKISKDRFDDCYQQYMTRKINKNRFADLLGVTWPTADKLIKAYEDGSISLEDGRYFVDPVKRNRKKEEENDQQ